MRSGREGDGHGVQRDWPGVDPGCPAQRQVSAAGTRGASASRRKLGLALLLQGSGVCTRTPAIAKVRYECLNLGAPNASDHGRGHSGCWRLENADRRERAASDLPLGLACGREGAYAVAVGFSDRTS